MSIGDLFSNLSPVLNIVFIYLCVIPYLSSFAVTVTHITAL